MKPEHHSVSEWHQDAGVGYRPGPMMILWITLSPCGEFAQGLQFVDAFDPPISITADIPHSEILGNFGESKIITEKFEAGDAAIFLSTTIHRTQVGENLNELRHNIEIRSISAEITPYNMTSCPVQIIDDIVN